MVEWKTIDEISSNIFAGGTPSTKHEEYYDGDIPWIRSGEIDFNVITSAERNITEIGYKNSSAKLIRKGSVVMAMTGATVAKSAIVDFETSANQSVCAIETDESIANYKYVYYCLSKDYFRIKSSAQGALTSLNLANIKQIEIPVPSLSEQQRIVCILDTFIASIDNLKEQIAQRRKQYEYYRDQLLDLEGKPGVEIKYISDVAKNFTGLTYKPENIVDQGTLVLRSSNIDEDMLSFKDNVYVQMNIPQRAIVKENDILICVRNGSKKLVGKCAMITKDAVGMAFGAFMTILRTTDINSKYLFYLWQSEKVKKQYKGDEAMPIAQITSKDFQRIAIPVPSLQLQQHIVSILDTFEASIQNLEAQFKQREKQYEYYRNKLLTFE